MTSISSMRFRLAELQGDDPKAKKIKKKQLGSKNWQEINRKLYYQGLFFVPKAICTKLISRHNNKTLAGHFEINKTRELVI